MKTVTIKQTYGEHLAYVSKHKSDTDEDAIEKAIRKHYGKTASLAKNPISTEDCTYGQITKPIKGEVNTRSCVTGMVCITVEG